METQNLTNTSLELNSRFIDLLDTLSALRDLSDVDIHSSNENGLLRAALRGLLQHQHLVRCSIFLREGDELCTAAGMDISELVGMEEASYTPRATRRIPIGEGLIGLAAQTGQLQHSRNTHDDPHFLTLNESPPDTLPGSLICAPIKHGEQLLGVLNISHTEVNYFSEWHEHMLTVYTNVLAMLIVNSRLLHDLEKQVQQRTQQLEKALDEARSLKQKYQELSFLDELTGLHNRRFFFLQAENILARAHRHDQDFCLMLMDMDEFKKINDSYGHSVGDQALAAAARGMTDALRDSDIVARLGGDEFAVILDHTDGAGALHLAYRIQRGLDNIRLTTVIGSPEISASIGIACLHDSSGLTAESVGELLLQADTALYASKAAGRGKVSLHAEPDDDTGARSTGRS